MSATTAVGRLLRIEEVSAEIGVPVETLRWWRGQGRGPKFAKLGHRLVCREADLVAWVDEQFAAEESA